MSLPSQKKELHSFSSPLVLKDVFHQPHLANLNQPSVLSPHLGAVAFAGAALGAALGFASGAAAGAAGAGRAGAGALGGGALGSGFGLAAACDSDMLHAVTGW